MEKQIDFYPEYEILKEEKLKIRHKIGELFPNRENDKNSFEIVLHALEKVKGDESGKDMERELIRLK